MLVAFPGLERADRSKCSLKRSDVFVLQVADSGSGSAPL